MLEVLDLTDKDEWDKVVKSFNAYDVYYLSGYVEAFKIHGDGYPLLFYFKNKEFKAMNVVMKRDISKHKNFQGILPEDSFYDLSTPYGYGGFIYQGSDSRENFDKLDAEYVKYCKTENIISEFTRFHPLLNNAQKSKDIYEIEKLGETVTITLHSKEQIWDNLKSKNRNVIRKAKKSGVEIFWGRSKSIMDTFIPMYNSTMDKDEATEYYYFDKEFYKSILTDLKYNMMFFYAVKDNVIVSIAMVLFANNNMHYHLSASNPAYNRYSPSNLLLNEVANWGVENGFTKFHLGGGLGSKEDGLFKFKSSFNKSSDTSFSIGRKIFDIEKYNYLCETLNINNDINKNGFFPIYRQDISN